MELEYEERGSGEPVILIHGSIVGNGLAPLLAENSLTGRHRVISYNRQGFGRSTHPEGPLSISQQAMDCRNLMRSLNVERAHIVGHSYGGAIALQLSADSPEHVHSLSLLEPVLPYAVFSTSPSAMQLFQGIMDAARIYQEGDKTAAINAFTRLVSKLPNYRVLLEKLMPGAFDQAVMDADTFFKIELPALQSWNFTNEDAKRVKQPVLFVNGAESGPIVDELGRAVGPWFPHAETALIPKATHSFLLTNQKGLTEALTGFFARHPLQVIA